MTDLEYDLQLSLEWWTPNPRFEDDTEVDCEETAKNLTKLGYQKIVWHDAEKELPDKNIYVVGYDSQNKDFAIVRFDGKMWFTDCFADFTVHYWTNIPAIDVRR